MSLVSTKWCSYSNLTTRTKYQPKNICSIQCQNLNKKKKTCIKAMFGTDGDDYRAWKRFIKLNSAIQNRSVKELFELACDECVYMFSSLPPFDPFSLSKRAFDLLHALMHHTNMTFVIKPTADQGFDFGIRWSIACKDHNLPLALGCNIQTSHLYKGNLTLRKANQILKPLLHIGNLSQIVEEKIMLLLDKIVPKDKLEGKAREAFMYILVSLIVMLIYYALMQKLV